jgi:hypothetical protein
MLRMDGEPAGWRVGILSCARPARSIVMTDEEIFKMQRDVRVGLARLAKRKLRDMRARLTRPRVYRLPKEARVLKSLVAEARAAGVVPPKRRKSFPGQARP